MNSGVKASFCFIAESVLSLGKTLFVLTTCVYLATMFLAWEIKNFIEY